MMLGSRERNISCCSFSNNLYASRLDVLKLTRDKTGLWENKDQASDTEAFSRSMMKRTKSPCGRIMEASIQRTSSSGMQQRIVTSGVGMIFRMFNILSNCHAVNLVGTIVALYLKQNINIEIMKIFLQATAYSRVEDIW